MKKGISLYFGYATDKEERFKLISGAGFDCIMTNFDERFDGQNGTMEEQLRFMKKYNLKPASLHSRYSARELPEFWKKGEIGDKLEANLMEDIRNASKYGFCAVVVHMFGKYSKVGEERIKRLLSYCEKMKVPFAIENIDDPALFKTIFEKIDHPYLKICYDSGHNNYVDKETDYLTLYRDKIVCLHLHDNNGIDDEHTLNRFGTINWDEIARKLALLPNKVSIDYEMLMYNNHNVPMQECLNETYKQAVELEKKILSYRRKNSKNK